MPQLLLIVVFLLVHVSDFAGPAEPPLLLGTALRTTQWALPPFAILCLLAYLWIRRCTVLMDKAGSWRAAQLGEKIAIWTRIAAVVVHAFNVLGLDWVRAVRGAVGNLIVVDELLAAAPVIAVWTFTWWAIEPIDRRIHEATLIRHLDQGYPLYPALSRGRFVWMSFRHGVLLLALPMTILMAWSEIVDRFGGAPTPDGHGGMTESVWALVVRLVGVGVIFALMPLVLRVVWDTVPLGDGVLRQRLVAMCRACGVEVSKFLVWRTNGLLINGAAVGLLRPLRYIVLTDALLDRLPGAQVEAVAAHEIGHVRRRHMLWLALSLLSTLMGVYTAAGLVDALVAIPRTGLSEAAAANTLVAASLVIGLLVFGFVSRRFEWQADAFAVQCLSGAFTPEPGTVPTITGEAVGAMNGALSSVADLNGIPRRRFSWRHGSIAVRQRRLGALIGRPAGAVAIDSQVRTIKIVSAVVLVAGVAWAIIEATVPLRPSG